VKKRWAPIAGLIAVAAGAVGWFLLDWLVMNNTPGDALGEAVGVAFGLLAAFSAIAVTVSRRGARP
jgi:ammonia channel protein AmtB